MGFNFEPVELDAPREDELIVRIVACGICHSDIAVSQGLFASHFPCILGHEGAGIVEKVGGKVVKVRPGDKVLLSFSSCGRCKYCKSGHPAQCLAFDELNFSWTRKDGSSTIWDSKGNSIGGNFFGQSSFAYFALTHERNVIPVKATYEELALFAPLGCGIQAGSSTVLNELKPELGESLVVFGAGAVGLAAVMAGHLLGVDPIIAVDIIPKRLELARELGAHFAINSKKDDVGKRLKELTCRVDNIVETTGHSRIIRLAMESLSPRGKISLLAISSDDPDESIPQKKPGRDQTIIYSIAGDSNPQEFIPFLISCYKKGKFPFHKLIQQYPASDINKAIKDSCKGTVIKPVLRFKPN